MRREGKPAISGRRGEDNKAEFEEGNRTDMRREGKSESCMWQEGGKVKEAI
jgi:hypothetical protein